MGELGQGHFLATLAAPADQQAAAGHRRMPSQLASCDLPGGRVDEFEPAAERQLAQVLLDAPFTRTWLRCLRRMGRLRRMGTLYRMGNGRLMLGGRNERSGWGRRCGGRSGMSGLMLAETLMLLQAHGQIGGAGQFHCSIRLFRAEQSLRHLLGFLGVHADLLQAVFYVLLQLLSVTYGQSAEQLVGDGQLLPECFAVLAMTQQGQRQHVRPGSIQQRTQQAAWWRLRKALGHQLTRAMARLIQPFAPLRGFHVAPLGGLGFACEQAQVVLDVG